MENDMSYKFIALGVAALVAASPVQAQRRGTVELGAFGGATSYDNSLSINNGTGGGLRIGRAPGVRAPSGGFDRRPIRDAGRGEEEGSCDAGRGTQGQPLTD